MTHGRMRGLCLLFLASFTLSAFAQRAPDIARGNTEAEVLRLYGWPKGKSVMDGRESWLYDRFQVTFDEGKVLSVAYVSTGTAVSARAQPPALVSDSAPAPGRMASVTASTQSGSGASVAGSMPGAVQVPELISSQTAVPDTRRSQSGAKTESAATRAGQQAGTLPENSDLIQPFGISAWKIAAGAVAVLFLAKIILAIAGARDRRFRDELLHRSLASKHTSNRSGDDNVAGQQVTARNASSEPPLISRTRAVVSGTDRKHSDYLVPPPRIDLEKTP